MLLAPATTTFFVPWNTHLRLPLAVFALARNAAAVGAPLLPGLRIFSPLPAAMRLRLACMFAYSPRFAIVTPQWYAQWNFDYHLVRFAQ